VITGLGVVTPLGHDLSSFWRQLLDGQCGIDKISAFDASNYDCQIAAQVKNFDPTPAFPSPKEIRRTDRFTQFGVVAGHKALVDSGLDLNTSNRDEIGVFIGSGIGGLYTTEEQHKILLAKSPSRVSPFMIPMLIRTWPPGCSRVLQTAGPTSPLFGLRPRPMPSAKLANQNGDAQVIFASR
jgi:3-oxoacyl-[acyl-carrier-protein] synthase II